MSEQFFAKDVSEADQALEEQLLARAFRHEGVHTSPQEQERNIEQLNKLCQRMGLLKQGMHVVGYGSAHGQHFLFVKDAHGRVYSVDPKTGRAVEQIDTDKKGRIVTGANHKWKYHSIEAAAKVPPPGSVTEKQPAREGSSPKDAEKRNLDACRNLADQPSNRGKFIAGEGGTYVRYNQNGGADGYVKDAEGHYHHYRLDGGQWKEAKDSADLHQYTKCEVNPQDNGRVRFSTDDGKDKLVIFGDGESVKYHDGKAVSCVDRKGRTWTSSDQNNWNCTSDSSQHKRGSFDEWGNFHEGVDARTGSPPENLKETAPNSKVRESVGTPPENVVVKNKSGQDTNWYKLVNGHYEHYMSDGHSGWVKDSSFPNDVTSCNTDRDGNVTFSDNNSPPNLVSRLTADGGVLTQPHPGKFHFVNPEGKVQEWTVEPPGSDKPQTIILPDGTSLKHHGNNESDRYEGYDKYHHLHKYHISYDPKTGQMKLADMHMWRNGYTDHNVIRHLSFPPEPAWDNADKKVHL